jgi:hypothetical protein
MVTSWGREPLPTPQRKRSDPYSTVTIAGLDGVLVAFGPFLCRNQFHVLNSRRSEDRAWPSAALSRKNTVLTVRSREKPTYPVHPNVLSLFHGAKANEEQPLGANLPTFCHVPRSLLDVSSREA